MTAWQVKSRNQAKELIPRWIDAVLAEYGNSTKYTSLGYCFGGPYVVEAAATDWVSAVAFAHPANVTEQHVMDVKRWCPHDHTLSRGLILTHEQSLR